MNSHSYILFDELWNRYNRRIYAYFRRQFDEHTAEDLCQQAYLNAWRYISAYANSNIKQNKAWLFTIAKNVRNDHLRYVQLHNMNFRYENLYEADTAIECTIDESIAIQKAFQKLSAEEKQLLSMSQHLTSKEIGSVLNISASAVRSRIQKARQHLREILKDFEINL